MLSVLTRWLPSCAALPPTEAFRACRVSVHHIAGIIVDVTSAEMTAETGASARRVRGCAVTSASHRDYVRWRARQIAYGRWEPWADAAPVREHVRLLRRGGTSYQAIGDAAGVSPMTVHYLMNGCRSRTRPLPTRISSALAQRLLAVPPAAVNGATLNACGSRRRLRALVALGHSAASLAADLGMSAPRVRRLVSGQTQSISLPVHNKVCDLYRRRWDQLPPERTGRERSIANAARGRARTGNWLPPMALDDDRIDDPNYRTRTVWRQAAGPSASSLSTAAYRCRTESPRYPQEQV